MLRKNKASTLFVVDGVYSKTNLRAVDMAFSLILSPINAILLNKFRVSDIVSQYSVFCVFQDGFYYGQTVDDKRGLIPSNYIEIFPGS